MADTAAGTDNSAKEIDYEDALTKLDELQSKLYKLRFELPNLLRELAHIDERQSANAIFNKSVKHAHSLNGEVDEFIQLYKQCGPALQLGRELKSKLKEQSKQQESSNASALAAQRSINNFMSGMNNQSSQGQSQNQSQNHGQQAQSQNQNQNQNQGQNGSQDQPIVVDDTMSFVQI